MTAECHYGQRPYHDKGEPLCHEGRCKASTKDRELFETARRLERMGYNLEELERDNPYNQWATDQ